MTKRLSVTISDLTFDTYISDIKGNRSEYIEKLIILGSDVLIDTQVVNQSKLLKLVQQNTNLQRELQTIKLQNDSLKSRIGKQKIDPKAELKRRVRAINFSGILGNKE